MGGRLVAIALLALGIGGAPASAIPPYLAGAKCGTKHASVVLEGSGRLELSGLSTDEVRVRDGRMVVRPRFGADLRTGKVIARFNDGSRMVYGVVVGTHGDDELRGGRRADIIIAGRGDDVMAGKGNGDLMCGGRGRDEATDHRIADITKSAKHDSHFR